MAEIFLATAFAVFFVLTFVAWRRYLWAAEKVPQADTCPYSLTDVFGDRHLVNVPHQAGNPVAHRGLQPLGREVSAPHSLADSAHRRIADLR